MITKWPEKNTRKYFILVLFKSFVLGFIFNYSYIKQKLTLTNKIVFFISYINSYYTKQFFLKKKVLFIIYQSHKMGPATSHKSSLAFLLSEAFIRSIYSCMCINQLLHHELNETRSIFKPSLTSLNSEFSFF